MQYKSKMDALRVRLTHMSGDDLDSKTGGFKQGGESMKYTDFFFAGGGESGGKSKVYVSHYAGLGYRAFENSKDHDNDYKRTFNNFYVLFGFDWKVKPGYGWIVSANTEFDYMLYGRSKNYGGDLSGSYRPEYGYGYNLGLKLEKDFGPVILFVEPYYRYWKIGNSEKKTVTTCSGNIIWGPYTCNTYKKYNPGHDTNETGVRVGLAF